MDNAPLILVVDDDGLLSRALGDALLKAGYTVEIAHDGPTGLQQAREKQPKLVLLDYQMPGMNGLDVLKELRSDDATKRIEVVFSTNTYDTIVINDALSLGVHDYVLKADISLDQIVELVKKYVPLQT